MKKTHYTYVLASKRRGALFIGVTDDLVNRVLDHKCNLIRGITSQYAIHSLVYFERHAGRDAALRAERSIRQMHRLWKLELIERQNPGWCDLYEDVASAARGLLAV